jgi:hypothetical protein
MRNTGIVTLLLLAYNNLNKFLSSENDSIYIKLKNIYSGYDERYDINNPNYNYNERVNNTMLYLIEKNMIKKVVIEELESKNTNIHRKLDIIEKYTELYKSQDQITGFNLFADDLMNKFYSVFDM